ncbi:cold-shock protein [Egicoccus sp. AB-alg2]|uniref:cold-shock protein n=1 Tax=Egicoccus sp. AB-alg2 TaxID=3242693 RepID=UPI00359D87AD
MPQGTVRKFDPATRTGTLLDDRLREYRYDRETFEASGLMQLRVGQRVRFELEGDEDDPHVTRLGIVSL